MQITYKQEVLRKMIHIGSLWMLLPMWFFPPILTIVLFALLLIGNVAIEYGAYKKHPLCKALYQELFGKMLREKETKKGFHLSGAPYVLASALMVSILFPMQMAMVALTTMLLSDSAAALIGRKFGRHRLNHKTKSLEGAAAFWVTGWLILVFYALLFSFSWQTVALGLIGLTLAAIAEVYEKQLHVDDNLSIPLICGFFLSLGA